MYAPDDKLKIFNANAGPKKIKKYTSLIQWAEGTSVSSKSTDKFLAFDLTPTTLVFCKEGMVIETLAKAYKDHWSAYDYFMGYQKFTKGKLPKVLIPDDPDKKRYLTITEPDKVGLPKDVLAKVIEAARDCTTLQAAFCVITL